MRKEQEQRKLLALKENYREMVRQMLCVVVGQHSTGQEQPEGSDGEPREPEKPERCTCESPWSSLEKKRDCKVHALLWRDRVHHLDK